MHVTASAPTRIDLAGGTIDIWPLYLFHDGAQTLNAAISLRAHVRLDRRDDDLVEIVSEDTGLSVTLASSTELKADQTLPLLAKLADAFAVKGIVIRTRGESPAGAGIAAALPDGDYTEAGARIVRDATALLAEADLMVMVTRPRDQDGLQAGGGADQLAGGVAAEEAERGRHLVVARARRVQPAGAGADQLGEPGFDVHVDVLEPAREPEVAAIDL